MAGRKTTQTSNAQKKQAQQIATGTAIILPDNSSGSRVAAAIAAALAVQNTATGNAPGSIATMSLLTALERAGSQVASDAKVAYRRAALVTWLCGVVAAIAMFPGAAGVLGIPASAAGAVDAAIVAASLREIGKQLRIPLKRLGLYCSDADVEKAAQVAEMVCGELLAALASEEV